MTGPAHRAGSIGIVGGGIIGLSIGWRLAQSGWNVTIFDRGLTGGEASWAAAGMLAPGGEYLEHSPALSYALASRHQYKPFIEELQAASGQSIDFQENGALELAYTAEELETLNAKAARQQELGIPSRELDRARVAAFWPRVQLNGLEGARFYPDDGLVNPREMTAALRTVCLTLGAKISEGTPVASVRIAEDRGEITSNGETRRFDAVVIATGAWSGSLPITGVPPVPPSKPIKGHLIGYGQPEQTCSTIVRHQHVYALQRANGLLIVGASVEDVGFDRTLESRVADQIGQWAARIFPHLAETTPSEVWTGFRPGGTLQVGPWHSRRLWLAYGHYRNGILLAPWTARKILDEISANLRMQ